jgi:hypothetical protein
MLSTSNCASQALGRGIVGRRSHARVIGDQRLIGGRSVAGPQPHQAVALAHHVRTHRGGLRDHAVSMRVVHAAAVAAETQAVVRALDHAAFADLARGQRREAVRAAVGQCRERTTFTTEEHQRLAEQRACQRAIGSELVGEAGHVPGVAQPGCHGAGLS